MEKRSAFSRIVIPIAVVFGVMVVASVAYDLSRRIENRALHLAVAYISAILLFLSIWTGALFANTMAFFRGAAFRERLLVSLATPVAYSAKVLYSLHGIYPAGEFLYFFLHSMILGVPAVGLLCMGISEIWCRAIHNRRDPGNRMKLFELNNIAVLAVGIGFTTLFLWQGGLYYIYNIYMKFYNVLFV